ncbi:MAG: hypothetical protein JXN62_03160 [Bacteroidales bacterium]|nr:hypothetical protein [Bacteroidales bacterium]
MRTIKTLILIFVPVIFIVSCGKIEQLPDTPYIEYRSFAIFDTIDNPDLGNECKGGKLKFYFEDGDGDLGLESPEEATGDTVNLFLSLYRKVDGVMVEVSDDDLLKPSGYRIPYIERTGRNKILKGTIEVTFLYLFYSTADTDTVRYDFYIKDRAGNISNEESTNEIALSENAVY